jgi:ParB/RepB/Spo0J family partition protein
MSNISTPLSVVSDNDDDHSLVWLDPRKLIAHPANVRERLRYLDDLADSISTSGIVEPLVVVPIEDGYRILAGHRRAAAAVRAELDVVPCFLRPDLADLEGDQIAVALAENIQRDNLSTIEEAHAYAQLSAFPEWTAQRIAKTTGRESHEVTRLIEVTKLRDAAQLPAARGDLSLSQAADLEEFVDEPDTYRRLINQAGKPSFRVALADAQRARRIARQIAETKATLEETGVTVIEKPASYKEVECELRYLTNPDDNTDIDEESHANCLGHAAFVDPYRGEAVYVCKDPHAYGHLTPKWYKHLTEEEAATWAAEEEAAKARELALEVAADVRRVFVRERIATKGKPPAGILRLAIEFIFSGHDLPSLDEVAWYLGHDDTESIDIEEALASVVRKASDTRLPLLLLAVTTAAAEDNLGRAPKRWGYSEALAVRWLSYLRGLGYALSDAEVDLLEAIRTDKGGLPGDELISDTESA